MAITASLTGNINITDNETGTIAFSKALSGLSVTGSSFADATPITIGSSPVTILPSSGVNFVYIKNTHATNTVTVTWTLNGGSSNNVVVLAPGSAIILVGTGVSAALTAGSITGSGAGTTVEYIWAG